MVCSTSLSSCRTGSEHSEPLSIQLASVVMKAVQARRPGTAPAMDSAGKLGDDTDSAKMQVCRCLRAEARSQRAALQTLAHA